MDARTRAQEDGMLDVFIVNHFYAARLQGLLESLAQQVPQAQVWIADNSEDAQERALLAQLRWPGPQGGLSVLDMQRNIGFGRACNALYARSRGEFVLLLNPDTRLLPACLPELLAVLREHPALAACAPRQWWDHEDGWMLPSAWLPTGINEWTLTWAQLERRQRLRISQAYRNVSQRLWNGERRWVMQKALSGAALMVRRTAVEQAGGLFDPAYFLYYEDSDLCLRLQRRAGPLALCTRAQIVHEWTHTARKIDWMEQSKQHYLATHFRGRGAWERRLQTLQARQLPDDGFAFEVLPLSLEHLPVPTAWQDGWVLELSPSPLLIPPVARLGRGPVAWVSLQDLSRRLGGHRLYLRLSDRRDPDIRRSLYFQAG